MGRVVKKAQKAKSSFRPVHDLLGTITIDFPLGRTPNLLRNVQLPGEIGVLFTS